MQIIWPIAFICVTYWHYCYLFINLGLLVLMAHFVSLSWNPLTFPRQPLSFYRDLQSTATSFALI